MIKPDTFMNVRDEGMPVHGRPHQKGNLYLHFVVEFPEQLGAELVSQLRKVLPKTPPKADASDNMDIDEDDVHEVDSMTPVDDIEHELKSRAGMGRGGSEAYDDEDEEDGPRGGQRVQCAQQ